MLETQAVSEMKFPRTRLGEHAVQAVSVMARRDHSEARESSGLGPEQARGARGWGPPAAAEDAGLRSFTFTFCLERIMSGPYKDCWMTVGVRCGDYANV